MSVAIAAPPPVQPAPRDPAWRTGRRPMVPLTLAIPDTLHARILQDARRRGVTPAAWLVEVAEGFLAEQALLQGLRPDDEPPASRRP